jgi:hypothetical protein
MILGGGMEGEGLDHGPHGGGGGKRVACVVEKNSFLGCRYETHQKKIIKLLKSCLDWNRFGTLLEKKFRSAAFLGIESDYVGSSGDECKLLWATRVKFQRSVLLAHIHWTSSRLQWVGPFTGPLVVCNGLLLMKIPFVSKYQITNNTLPLKKNNNQITLE